jgi:signal transduction histidine kinase
MDETSNREANPTHSPRDIATQWEIAKQFREIHWRINRGLVYETVLDFAFSALAPLIPFDRLGIALLNEAGTHASLVWVRAKTPVQNLRTNYTYTLKGSSLERMLETKQPRIIDDLESFVTQNPDSHSARLALADGVRSSFACPLVADNETIGIAFFSSFTAKAYRDHHVELFRDLAGELSVIIEQGRLKRFFEENRSKIQVLGTILHDLRVPIGIIQGYLDVALGESWYEKADKEAKSILAHLRKSSREMGRMLDELQELTRLGTNPATQAKVPIPHPPSNLH